MKDKVSSILLASSSYHLPLLHYVLLNCILCPLHPCLLFYYHCTSLPFASHVICFTFLSSLSSSCFSEQRDTDQWITYLSCGPLFLLFVSSSSGHIYSYLTPKISLDFFLSLLLVNESLLPLPLSTCDLGNQFKWSFHALLQLQSLLLR